MKAHCTGHADCNHPSFSSASIIPIKDHRHPFDFALTPLDRSLVPPTNVLSGHSDGLFSKSRYLDNQSIAPRNAEQFQSNSHLYPVYLHSLQRRQPSIARPFGPFLGSFFTVFFLLRNIPLVFSAPPRNIPTVFRYFTSTAYKTTPTQLLSATPCNCDPTDDYFSDERSFGPFFGTFLLRNLPLGIPESPSESSGNFQRLQQLGLGANTNSLLLPFHHFFVSTWSSNHFPLRRFDHQFPVISVFPVIDPRLNISSVIPLTRLPHLRSVISSILPVNSFLGYPALGFFLGTCSLKTDWNYVEAIQFSFGKPVEAGKNNTLKPNAISRIKSLVTAAIIENLPISEVSLKCKQHIRMLLEHSTIWYLDKDTTRRPVHDYHALAPAANAAKLHYHQYKDPTIQLEFSIQHWGFDKEWYPYEFAKVYDRNSSVAMASEKSKPLKPLPTLASYNNRVENILKFSRRIISREKEFCFDLPDPYFEYVAFKRIYRMTFPPSYTWTWKYSPNSDSVSFHRVRSNSISFQRATPSSSPPAQCLNKSTVTPLRRHDKFTATALPVTPSTLPSSDHHSAPPWGPTNFVWTFNPQNEIATFRHLPKSAPSPSPQPPMYDRLIPSETLAEDTDRPHPAPAYIRSLQSPCHNHILSRPNHPPVLRLSKRHRDALKVKLYHLYANILSMNWFYNTFD
eukprot:jgi/Psemu1/44417/gm1.44417_g